MSETITDPAPATSPAPGAAGAPAPTAYPHGFARIDTRIVTLYGPRIGALGLALYLVLSFYADNETRACFPSTRTLSRSLELSRPTVLKTICMLEAAGLVTVARGGTLRGKRPANIYTLLPIPDGQPALPQTVNHVDHAGPSGQPALPPAVNHVDHRGQGGLPELDLLNKTQEDQRESVREQPAPAPDPHPDDAAIKVYWDACRWAPDQTQRAAIAATVTDLAHWAAVIRQWLLAGYRKQNVAGMLDWYRDGIPERSGIHGRNAAGGRAGGSLGFQGHRAGEWRETRPPETPEETARLDAEWDAYVREARNRSQSHEA